MDSRTRTCFLYETWRPAFQHFGLSGFQDSKGRVSGCWTVGYQTFQRGC